MANSEIAVGAIVPATKINEVTLGTTAPAATQVGSMWLNTNAPRHPELYIGSAWRPVFPRVHFHHISGFTITSDTPAAITGTETFVFHPGIEYFIEYEGTINAGGTIRDFTLQLVAVSGSPAPMLQNGMIFTAGDSLVATMYSSILSGNTITLSAEARIGQVGFQEWMRGWLVLEVDVACSYQFRAFKDTSGGTSDPSIGEFFYKTTFFYNAYDEMGY